MRSCKDGVGGVRGGNGRLQSVGEGGRGCVGKGFGCGLEGDDDGADGGAADAVAAGEGGLDDAGGGGGLAVEGLVELGIEGFTGIGFVGDDPKAADGIETGCSVLRELMGDARLRGAEAGLVDRKIVVEEMADHAHALLFAPPEFVDFKPQILAFLIVGALLGFDEGLAVGGELLGDGGRGGLGPIQGLLAGLELGSAGGDGGCGLFELLHLSEGVGEVFLFLKPERGFLVAEEWGHKDPGADGNGDREEGSKAETPFDAPEVGQPGNPGGGTQQAEVSHEERPFGGQRNRRLGHG